MAYCTKCGNKINKDDLFCGECGSDVKKDAEILDELKKISKNEDRDYLMKAKCPRCGSTSLSYAGLKKGYSVGKAVVASIFLTPIFGPLFGIRGKTKTVGVCLNCGTRFKCKR